ncbi:2-hydroxymuconate tautomerase family protein [Sessilibacter sp. MAH2]
MPFINVKLIKNEKNKAKKAELIRRLTEVMTEVMDKPPASTHVVIEEIDAQDWGVAGIQISER